jgi:exodeoxyribonuclease-5
MTLTAQQQEGLDKVRAWFPMSGQAAWSEPFRWFGYAGTGKTYTAAQIPEALGLRNVVFGTYTGKAASVLRRSLARYGVDYPVSTIHSAIYKPTTSKEAREALDAARAELAEMLAIRQAMKEEVADGHPEVAGGLLIATGWADMLEFNGALSQIHESIPQLEADARRVRFEFNPESDWAFASLIILDEVSMVNAKLAADIESYGVPILVLGDPAQLPPVEGGGYYTDATPDHLLTDIQRAALDSPVTALATQIRTSQGLGIPAGIMRPPSLKEAMEADVVLCWTNRKRWNLIKAIRSRRGLPDGQPAAGDTVMALTNNGDAGVFNGELFTVMQARPDGTVGWVLDVQDESGRERELLAFAEGFTGQQEQDAAKRSGAGMKGQRVLATFGQVITVHKAQGSEWDRVYLVNETPGMISMGARGLGEREAIAQARRWLYTGVTRAKEEITVTRPT